mmetsp:Transcript_60979/g.145311  ORF Transcript_60979/g.145311 Transcript_60979/m.145311 type:complete len:150 (-) Transcript_60979:64-513(-)
METASSQGIYLFPPRRGRGGPPPLRLGLLAGASTSLAGKGLRPLGLPGASTSLAGKGLRPLGLASASTSLGGGPRPPGFQGASTSLDAAFAVNSHFCAGGCRRGDIEETNAVGRRPPTSVSNTISNNRDQKYVGNVLYQIKLLDWVVAP